MARPVQCVTCPGGSEQVNARIFATLAIASFAVPGGRVLSRKGVHPCFGIPRLPAPHRRAAYPGLAGHLGHGQSLARQQHDPGTLNVFLWTVSIRGNRNQLLPIGVTNDDANYLNHPANLAEPQSHVKRSSASAH